jgi:hypothetical protein
MFKFNLGDKVRHIDKQIFGEVAGMECYNEDKVYAIRTKQGLEHFIEDALEDFRFKEGDRVIGLIGHGEGLVGTISRTDKTAVAEHLVEFDDGSFSFKFKENIELIPQHELDQYIQGAVVKSTPEPPLPQSVLDASERIGGLVKDLGSVFGIRSSARLENLPTADLVNNPPHYTFGNIETIEYIKDKLTPEQYEGFLIGTVHRYVSRYRHKGKPIQDLEKASVYLGWLIEHLKGE